VIRIALIGQPNCGKSSLFNSVAGYKAMVGNFPGTSQGCVSSRVSVNGETFELVDLPGIYSLSSPEPEQLLSRQYLISHKPDAVINIVDASVLSRSLELTLELLELQIPLVVCLNMMDEASRKGIQVDVAHLSLDLGVPVVPTIATRGQGVEELFRVALEIATSGATGRKLVMSSDVESVVSELTAQFPDGTARDFGVSSRLLALKLLEQDEEFEKGLRKSQPDLLPDVQRLRDQLATHHGRPADVVISSERHSQAVNLFEHVATVKPRLKKSRREQVDKYLLHPWLGYVFLGAILFAFFSLVFGFGKYLEIPLLSWLQRLNAVLTTALGPHALAGTLLHGLLQGFSGGIGIVLPYLIPFLLGLALLEDIGYLPRAAFLMDSIMHRLGLHGKSIIPFVLGYGCNVPSIMGVKTMERQRDRFITAILVTFIPCAARTTIIFALVGFYLGPAYALSLYLINLIVIAAVGSLMSWLMPEVSPGMIIEMPTYKLPSVGAIAKKMWFRLREFAVIAWPLLIAGSLVLSLLDYFHLSGRINGILSPFTSGVLGLPAAVGITLIFGILRKELTVIMLVQALGTSNFSAAMTAEQMMVFTIFSLFYVPCLATLGMLRSVLGYRGMLFALIFNTAVGSVIALLYRLGNVLIRLLT